MRRFVVLLFCLCWVGFSQVTTLAQEAPGMAEAVSAGQMVYPARIEEIYEGECLVSADQRCKLAKAVVFLENGQVSEQIVQLSGDRKDTADYQVGQQIWINQLSKPMEQNPDYVAIGPNRSTTFWILAILFVTATIVIARWKGISALVSLGISTGLIFLFLLPQIFANPQQTLWLGILTAFLILVCNQLIGHGLSKVSLVALATGVTTYGIIVLISLALTEVFKITGLGADSTTFLRDSLPVGFNFANLFLVGTLLGVCGALDDVTSAQAAAVDELHRAQPDIGFKQLFSQGMRIGNEHLISMVNTLFLAYLGAALPTLLIFNVLADQNFFAVLSREDITEEILRSVLASFGLVLAVPLTTALAALVSTRPAWIQLLKSKWKFSSPTK